MAAMSSTIFGRRDDAGSPPKSPDGERARCRGVAASATEMSFWRGYAALTLRANRASRTIPRIASIIIARAPAVAPFHAGVGWRDEEGLGDADITMINVRSAISP